MAVDPARAIEPPAGEVVDRARHHIAVRLLPFLFILYITNYLDRTNLAYAALGMSRDLGYREPMSTLARSQESKVAMLRQARIRGVGLFRFRKNEFCAQFLARLEARIAFCRYSDCLAGPGITTLTLSFVFHCEGAKAAKIHPFV